MSSRSTVPFAPATYSIGPFAADSHPLQLDLQIAGEEVIAGSVRAVYNGRAVERGLAQLDWPRALALCARLCDCCSFANTLAFVRAAETIAGLRVPLRAEYLRYVFAEAERACSHLCTADRLIGAAGARRSGELRQLASGVRRHLHMIAAPGGKLAYGGVLESVDPAPAAARAVAAEIGEVLRQLAAHARAILADRTQASRLVGQALVTKEQIMRFDLRGPLARASGVARDLRHDYPTGLLEYLAAESPDDPLRTALQVQDSGDAYSRLTIWLLEAIDSLRVTRDALEALPRGPVWASPTSRDALTLPGRTLPARRTTSTLPVLQQPIFTPGEEALTRVEAPRGEVTCVVVAGVDGPSMAHLHTASYAALPLIDELLPELALVDVPVALASLDICLPCAEK